MSNETPEQNRHSRAVEAAIGRDADFDHRLLTQHAPAAGPNPACRAEDCGKPWPCALAETAMRQVGVHS
ncbi:hypothetical protein [Streptomyces sp. NPDC058745]|uniref:hypothetical protein n=1 Tax=Streptomyces sp. NPDC058745 TaxID=3346621 RepID=UPI0036B0CF60